MPHAPCLYILTLICYISYQSRPGSPRDLKRGNIMNLVFLGFGTIAGIIYAAIENGNLPGIKATGVLDPALSNEKAEKLGESGVPVFKNLDEAVSSSPDLVVEAASQQAAKDHVPFILSRGIDVLSLSVGAYLDPKVMDRISKEAEGSLYISSGALPCMDAVKAASLGTLNRVELTTRKRPRALLGAPGLDLLPLDIAALKEPYTVFQGNAADAVRLFPANVNIAATLSLAGVGGEKTRVKIIADPDLQVNIHELHLAGDFGTFAATIECLPSANPKTSMIAASSAISVLKNLKRKIKIGN
jgi:aspartate dehydrogenase